MYRRAVGADASKRKRTEYVTTSNYTEEKRHMNLSHTITRKPIRSSAFAMALLAGSALGGLALERSAQAQDNTVVNPPVAAGASKSLSDFSGLVSQVKPAVVSITNKMKATAVADNDDDGDDAGPQMHGMPFPFGQMMPHGRNGQSGGHAAEARGSGFIVSADGIVVTNNHVVKDAKTLSVTLDDGTVLPAKVIGTDPRTDIAVLKVDAKKKLPYIQLGNSRDVKPGEWVVAMGNPFGLGGSVTAGIVSAVSRDIGQGPYDQFIQVDAPINHGNSGGPLFTQDGKVIGMNTAIYSPNGGSVGIGFAIPSDMIRTVTAQLEKTGHVTRGYIGVEAQQITPDMAKAMHLTENGGALLAGLQPDSPASEAGLQPGDVIAAVNGTKITNPKDLAVNISAIQPGDEAHLTVLHDGQTKDVAVKIATLPGEKVASKDGAPAEGRGKIGVALAPLTPEARDKLDVPEGTKGAVVRGVQPGSPAEVAGLQAGDVIVGVGTKPVTSPDEAAKAMRNAAKSADHAVALRVIRNGQPLFVGVDLDEASNEG